MRFYRKHEWQITNYAVIAYAALAAAPLAVGSESWRTWVSWFAVVLVLLAAGQALRTLWYSNALRLVEHTRLLEAITHLPLLDKIYEEKHRPTQRSERPLGVRMPSRPGFPWGLALVVLLGATIAIVIILSRIPYAQRAFACISAGAA